MCAHTYRPFRQRTIYPQLVVGCDDNLNRALLKEFAPLNNKKGDPARTPCHPGPSTPRVSGRPHSGTNSDNSHTLRKVLHNRCSAFSSLLSPQRAC